MGLEIERRFLVAGEGWRSHVLWKRRLQQGYLSSQSDGLTLRVRITRAHHQQASAWLTIKAPPTQLIGQHPDGLIRQEFEYPIPIEDAEALLCMAPHQVCKWRHGLDLAGGDWVLDVFDGPNAPLVVAEVELADARQAVPVPPWCVLELTGRHELSNAALACKPFVSWPDAPRALLLQALENTAG